MAGDFQKLRHFIWDFDGTLFDTYPVIIGDLRSALREFGQKLDYAEAMGLMLTDFTTALNHYADQFGIDRQALQQCYHRYHLESCVSMTAQPMPQARDVLAHVCRAGRSNYIFTHKPVGETEKYLEKYGLSQYFREIIGPDSACFARKPAPDAILYLLSRYHVPREEAAMVGDRDCDLGSARNAGIGTIHLQCPLIPQALVCDQCFQDFGEMLVALQNSF